MKISSLVTAAIAGAVSASPLEKRQQGGGGNGPYGPGVRLPSSTLTNELAYTTITNENEF